jgi:membrane-anchored protein YejM (alkaline phosphatase superfamily)
LAAIPEKNFLLTKKPNIFLFILESAREDFITPEIAPALSRFREENFAFDLSMSNANCSHISWFTILNSTLPLHWIHDSEATDKKGSLPLQILKKMGYKINVYSSARLNYHNAGVRNFGEECYLIDSYYNAPDCETPDEFDRKTIAKLQEDIKNHPDEGHVHIIFLDGTHSYYYYPEAEPFITPVCPKGESLMSIYSNEVLEKLKNRYRNALHYLDSLFGNFLKTLEMTRNGKNAVIAVVGDHGEEFFEHGCIFHSSNLSNEQLHIPIYYKFGENNELPTDRISLVTSAIDIFPTIFDYLCKSDFLSPLFDGESIFRTKRWPYIVSARQNGVQMSKEFSIHNGRYKLHLKFSNLKEVFKSPSLYILSVKDLGDNPVPFNSDFLEQEFGPAIQRLFSP